MLVVTRIKTRFLPLILLGLGIAIFATPVFGQRAMPELSDAQIHGLLSTAETHYINGQFRKAKDALEQIPVYQYTRVERTISLIDHVIEFTDARVESIIAELARLNVNTQQVITEVCADTLISFNHKAFLLCAELLPGFGSDVELTAREELRSLADGASRQRYDRSFVSRFMNQHELTGETDSDLRLFRERMSHKAITDDCRQVDKRCGIARDTFADIMHRHIFPKTKALR